MIGSTLSHFQITAELGEGGMGRVYRAEDTRLGREVAIKVLPEAFVADTDRLARFEREARVLASLSHPNVAGIYEVGEQNGTHFLVMELAAGETLEERIARGPIPVDDAIGIARQIAEGLEAAHESGIVHRDLKPANVKVDGHGKVKILDFGLAKALGDEAADRSAELSHSPTLTARATVAGVLMGTAAYMAPEQAKGQPVDKRADVWALGVVLAEMLLGARLFAQETLAETLAAVLGEEPDLSRLPPELPPSVRRLIARCLRKDPRQRLHDVADARLDLEDARESTFVGQVGAASVTGWRPSSALVMLGLTAAVAALLSWLVMRTTESTTAAAQTATYLELSGVGFDVRSLAAISRDGRQIAYVPAGGGDAALQVRDLGEPVAREIPGTEGARNPFFSPDGKALAYFLPRERALFVVRLDGGERTRITDTSTQWATGVWTEDGTMVLNNAIVDGARWRGLARVPEGGGKATPLTELEAGEQEHVTPASVPGGRWLLFTVIGETLDLHALSLVDGSRHLVAENATGPAYSLTGHVVAVRLPEDGSLVAYPFDAGTATVTGPAVEVETGVSIQRSGTGSYALSDTGTLLLARLRDGGRVLPAVVAWIDRAGRSTPLLERPRDWIQPRLSPNGETLVVREGATPNCTLWTYDLRRGTLSRLTFEGDAHDPAWRPARGTVTYAIDSVLDDAGIWESEPGSGGRRTHLLAAVGATSPSWTRDGRRLVFQRVSTDTGSDLWLADFGQDLGTPSSSSGSASAAAFESPEAQPLLATPFDEVEPELSPAADWFAYVSNESGRDEVYLRPLSEAAGRIQVSVGGGHSPAWSPDGRTLYYLEARRLMAVEVELEGPPRVSVPAPVLLPTEEIFGENVRNYEPVAGDERFVRVERRGSGAHGQPVEVVIGWGSKLNSSDLPR